MKSKLSRKLKVVLCLALAVATVLCVGVLTSADTVVAKIGDTGYATLADAIAAAEKDDTIVLADDIVLTENAGVTIPAGLTVTLDLNGHHLSNNITEAAASQVILNNGTLTIKDSSAGQTGSISTLSAPDSVGNWNISPRRNWQTVAVNNYGTLTLKSGKIVSTAAGGIAYAIDNMSGATLNVTGGTVETLGATEAIRMFVASTTSANTVNISGGTVTASGAVWIQACGKDGVAGVLNITGGVLNTKTGYRIVGFEADDPGTTLENVKVNVSGGKFSKSEEGTNTGYPFEIENFGGATATFDPSYIELTGGTFWLNAYNHVKNSKEGTLEDLCAKGYTVYENTPEEGWYTVKKTTEASADTVVAKIDETEYATLAEAIAAAKNDDTIVLA
ncbi:MAG: hypothetical protein MJ078_06545, partial [Clostridia bacterium]|nr:hypothetical protein [Clostridia bacterium]